jgi:hypothetical protein
VIVEYIDIVKRIETVNLLRDYEKNEIRRKEYESFRCGKDLLYVVKGNIKDV